MTANHLVSAYTLKQLLIESSPFIEEYTAHVCPGCTDVCCRQKHGLYHEKDIRYLQAIGVVPPQREETRPPEGPCECMGPRGCGLPRWMRPFKCTWYFCEPLLKALDESPARRARKMSAMLQKMADLYAELAKE
jgi:hypothetical protein